VIAMVMQITPFAGPSDTQAPIHARALGLEMASGAQRWTLDI